MDILIALDSYDDLFSDFDIRGFNERPISRDFLDELNLRMKRLESKEGLRIVFVLDAADRKAEDEAVIARRVEKFFADRHAHYRREDRKTTLRSFAFVLIGLLLLVVANFFSKYLPSTFREFLLIPSWYFVWSGLEHYVDSRAGMREKKRYYGALGQARLAFQDR